MTIRDGLCHYQPRQRNHRHFHRHRHHNWREPRRIHIRLSKLSENRKNGELLHMSEF